MHRTSLLACLLFIACGSSTPAESPDEASEFEDETSEEASPSSGDEENASEAPSEKDADQSAGDASGDDLKTVLQLVLEDEELDGHLKLGQPGRFPLQIAGPGLPDGLVKATKPVVVVAEPSDKKEAVLVFTEIDVKGKDATVRYRYDVENMHGTAILKKGPHGWELTRSRVVARTKVDKE